jgi:hypothetical protein
VGPIAGEDWADPAVIRAEWSDRDDVHRAVETSCEGMTLALADDEPDQRYHAAEAMTRALCYHLDGRGPLTDAQVMFSIVRILDLLERVPDHQLAELRPLLDRPRRLALAVMRDRGWQPSHLGGDGCLGEHLDSPGIRSAVATTRAPGGRTLEYFFGRV